MVNSLFTFFSTYIFLLSGVYFFFWWVVLFVSFRHDHGVRKKILALSILVSIATPFVEHLNLSDWWSPVFVWDTYFHVEDLLFGFTITGTTLGIYFWISRKTRASIQQEARFSASYKAFLLLSVALIMFVPFYFAHIPSFYTESACMLFLSVCVFARIPSMILPAIMTGIVLTLLILPGYFIATYLHPGWIQEYWTLAGWPGRLFLTIPIGEYIFYLLSGLYIPAFAELLFGRLK